jgi:hypothetical protein
MTAPRPSALAVRQAWENAHPEITIRPPITAPSRQWELETPGGTTLYSDFWTMIDHLAALLGETAP